MEKRHLFVSADALELRFVEGHVYVRVNGLGNALNLAEGIELVLALTPDESDRLALALQSTALLARGKSPLPPSRS